MALRKNQPFKEGELELVLSLIPTAQHIEWLSKVLDRTPGAIEVIYRKAYSHGKFTASDEVMLQKIKNVKKKLGIIIGRR